MNWFKKFFENVGAWFNRKPKQVITARPEATPVVEISRQPGLTCPECATRIQVSISMLLSHQPVVCPACGLVLELDVHQSEGALNALRKLQHGLDAARQAGK